MNIRLCALNLNLWLLFHVAALNLHLCFSLYLEENGNPDVAMRVGGIGTSEGVPSLAKLEDDFWQEFGRRRYFYAHNETRIAMARAEAEAQNHDAGGATPLASVLGSPTFPDFAPSENGCLWDSVGAQDLCFGNRPALAMSNVEGATQTLIDDFQVLAVDSCSREPNVYLGYKFFEICSQRWAREKADNILIRDDPSPVTRSFKVLVKICTGELEVLADGVYFPATGKMHLVGCARGQQILPDFANHATSTPLTMHDFELSRAEMMNVTYDVGPVLAESLATEELDGTQPPSWYGTRWHDPDDHHEPPLNSSAFQDCAISATLQYPPLNCRWNSDRVLKYSVRSNRAKDDPLYFAPLERIAFFPYFSRYYNSEMPMQSQRRLETGVQILLLVLGLGCVAVQIEHGRKHEESLPFVSLVMLAIQLAHHLSQTSIFKDLQISGYSNYGLDNRLPDNRNGSSFPEYSTMAEDEYYATMAWSGHLPYQAMAMAAIFMYVWMFHKVGDRRRIMRLRVIRRRPGAKDPPSDWRVMYATLAFFAMVLFLGFVVIGADHDGHFRRVLTGMTDKSDYEFEDQLQSWEKLAPSNYEDVSHSPGFVSWRLYELSQAQWGFVNRLAGVVVSLFLVPQLLGNRQWEVHGHRPLSAWFYAGIPFLQSLPHACSIAKHFQLLPIFPLYDPYINSLYGFFENPTPWWHIAVVSCSSLQVLAVHSQFSRSLIRGSRQYHSSTKSSSPHHAQTTLDVL